MNARLPITLGLLVLLPLLLITPAVAQEVTITPFHTQYSLYVSGTQVANSELSLQKTGTHWRWRLAAKPYGLFALISSKEPYSETVFSLDDGLYRIDNLLINSGEGRSSEETASFNWDEKKIAILRKNQRSSRNLQNEVYDYLGINWLAAQMLQYNIERTHFSFYYKGALIKSTLKRGKDASLEIADKTIVAQTYEQTSTQSNSALRFYYTPETPLIPLKIEAFKSGEQTSVLKIKSLP